MVKSGEIRAVYQKCSLEPDEDTSDKVFQSNSEFFIKCLDKSGFVRTSDSPHTEQCVQMQGSVKGRGRPHCIPVTLTFRRVYLSWHCPKVTFLLFLLFINTVNTLTAHNTTFIVILVIFMQDYKIQQLTIVFVNRVLFFVLANRLAGLQHMAFSTEHILIVVFVTIVLLVVDLVVCAEFFR